MRVLVNGASGYIGKYLVKELLENGHEVIAVSRKQNDEIMSIPDAKLTVLASEQAELYRKLASKKIDVWYQLAWDGATGERRKDPDVQTSNVRLTTEAFEMAEKIGCAKFVCTGTIYEKLVDEYRKEGNTAPGRFYVFAKAEAFEKTKKMALDSKMRFVWARFCHPVGPGIGKNQLMYYTCDTFANNKDSVFSSCDHLYDIISVRDLAFGIRLLGEKDLSKEEYYIGHEGGRTLNSYIRETAEIAGYTKEIGFGKRPDDGISFSRECFAADDFVKETGWYEREGYEQAVKELCDILRTCDCDKNN